MKSSFNLFRCILLFFLSGLLMDCEAPSGQQVDSDTLRVVTTTGMLADLVRNIGGTAIEVEALMGPGVDPHLYKATRGDLTRLQEADLIIYNGLHLEGKMGEVLEKLGRIKPVLAFAEGIPSEKLLQDSLFQGNYDPHIWFDVALWASGIPSLVDAMSLADAKNGDTFRMKGAAYKQTLEVLDTWVRDTLQGISTGKRVVVTAHDAFNYFGRAYDMEVKGLQGISTLSEFGLRDRVALVDFLVDRQIGAVFVETSVSTKNIESIIEGCRQKGHEVQIGGNLFSDAMGAADTPEGTYSGMVKANVRTIVESLNAY